MAELLNNPVAGRLSETTFRATMGPNRSAEAQISSAVPARLGGSGTKIAAGDSCFDNDVDLEEVLGWIQSWRFSSSSTA
jgi:hypothetical protein